MGWPIAQSCHIIVGVLALCAASPGFASTYYVAPGGDNNAAGSSSAPWATLTYAAGQLKAGDVLTAKDGEYREGQVIFDKIGTASSHIVVKSEHKWGAKIISTSIYHAVDLRGDYTDFSGFEITFDSNAQGADGIFGLMIVGAKWVTVRDCYVHDCPRSGIQAGSSDRLTIENNVSCRNAYWADGSGISIWDPVMRDGSSPGFHFYVRNNICFDNQNKVAGGGGIPTDGNGVIIDYCNNAGFPDSVALVENNVCYHNGGRGIHCLHSDHCVVRNNTVYYNMYHLSRETQIGWDGALSAVGSSGCVFANNIAIRDPSLPRSSAATDYGNTGARNAFINNCIIGDIQAAPDGSAAPQVSGTVTVMPSFAQLPAFANASDAFNARTTNADLVDFHLKAGSSCIDAGTLAEYAPLDFDGIARVTNGRVDIGAYEYRTSTAVIAPPREIAPLLGGRAVRPAVFDLRGRTLRRWIARAPRETPVELIGAF